MHPQASESPHIVQFYEHEDFLHGVVADFLEPGFDGKVPMVVIATAAHRRAFLLALASRGHDVVSAQVSGLLTMLDARETLSKLMVAGRPDPDLFRQHVGSVVRAAVAKSPTGSVRAYGEMVDLLWRDENGTAAVQLEDLWNALGREHAFTLLCAYGISGFERAEATAGFRSVCDVHSHVRPTERCQARGESQPRLRELTLLEQRTRALENELEAHRKTVAELQEVQRQLEERNRELAASVRSADQFVNILGHDLRNPLSAIMTAAGLMRRRSTDENVTKPSERILSSADRMARMVDQLLDFARSRLGKGLQLDKGPSDLAEVCRMVLDEHGSDRITLEVRGDATGVWDVDRLAQLVRTLVGNALTHGRGDTKVTLDVDGTAERNVQLTIANRGTIPAELLPALFEPRDGKRDGSKALGLGLYICRQIALEHRGSLDVASGEELGTRFTLTLPRKA